MKLIANQPAQRDFMQDWKSQACAYVGGWGSGKSWAGARKLIHQHLYNAVDSRGRLTGCKSLAIAETHSQGATLIIPSIESAADELGIEHRMLDPGKLRAIEFPRFSGPRDHQRSLISLAKIVRPIYFRQCLTY